MRQLTAFVLALGLAAMIHRRREDILLSQAGRDYLPRLVAKATELERLIALEKRSAQPPQAERLAELSTQHDGLVRAIDAILTLIEVLPGREPEQVAAALRIREAILPDTGVNRASYHGKVLYLKQHEAPLARHAEDLARFEDGRPDCLAALVRQWTRTVGQLDATLDERGLEIVDASLTETRAALVALRPRILGLLGRFRGALADEVEHDESLPRNLVERIFSYFDQVVAEAEASAPAEPAPAATATPA